MWYPVSLKIVNLFSHEDSTFDFINNKTTLVSGVNRTDTNVESNGSGKTSILDCISISIIGEPLRDISKKEIVRNGERNGSVVLILKNNILGKELKIESFINSTSSNKVLIWENDELNSQLKDLEAKESYKYILKEIGVSKEDLVNYFLISKDSYQSFFLNGDTAKKEIINRFSKANTVDAVEPLMKEDLEKLNTSITKFKTQFETNAGVLTHLEEEINKEKLESSIEQTRQLTTKTLEEEKEAVLKKCEAVPDLMEAKATEIDAQNTIVHDKVLSGEKLSVKKESIEKEISVLEIDIDQISKDEDELEESYQPKFDKLNESIKKLEEDIKENNTLIKDCDKDIAEIDSVLAGKIQCPKCEEEFVLKDKTYDIATAIANKEELESVKKDLQDVNIELESDILKDKEQIRALKQTLIKEGEKFAENKTGLKTQLKEIESRLTQIKKEISENNNSLDKESRVLKTLRSELEEIEASIDKYETQIANFDKAIEEELAKKYPDNTAETKKKIETLQQQNVELNDKIENLMIERCDIEEWQVRFKQFKSFLANSSISAIEEMTNYFLLKMKTNLTVQIDGYRELSNKKLKEEITTLVTRDGLNGESFSKFSGGEKARVDIACILAMQKIINLASNGGGLNLLFIDEILESADSKALTGITKALSELEQTIFLITHVDQNMFECNKLLVEKTNGVSKIVSL